MNKRIVVFDLETRSLPKNDAQWKDWGFLGISVAASYDWFTGQYGVYALDNIQKLVDLLNSADVITGFNIMNFDVPLLSYHASELDRPLKNSLISYDMLLESWAGAERAGLKKPGQHISGFKLDNHLISMLGPDFVKTGEGAMAPALWESGRTGELMDYCLNDAHRERLLFEEFWKTGKVSNKAFPDGFEINRPQEMMDIPIDTAIGGVIGETLGIVQILEDPFVDFG